MIATQKRFHSLPHSPPDPWLSDWLSELAVRDEFPMGTSAVLEHAITPLLHRLPIVAGGNIQQIARQWRCQHWFQRDADSDVGQRPRESQIEDLIDRCQPGRPLLHDSFLLIPMAASDEPGDAASQTPHYLCFVKQSGSSPFGDDFLSAATLIGTLFHQSRRCNRLTRQQNASTKLLRAAAAWQVIDDLDELLSAVASTATEILGCHRASIFLHEKRRGVLVGRPAIGVPGGSLTVPDDRGIVGDVLASGEGHLWTRGDDPVARQNADVDAQTDFETHSLAAVPMFRWRGTPSSAEASSNKNKISGANAGASSSNDSAGTNATSGRYQQTQQCIGVFEAINRIDGPFTHEHLLTLNDLAMHASVAIATQSRRQKLIQTRDRLIDDATADAKLIGDDASMQHLRSQLARIAPTDLSVLIRGENGTGKEILARQVHYQSERRDGPFVAVNCAAIVETLLESELFGHEKGSFTDASQTRIGKFEAAAGGTLFLDEIGDMTAGGQSKLLRALETREIVRVGGTQSIGVDVRILAATNQPLETLIAAKQFREDLFFRLAVISLTLPPLRERGNDVVQLAEHFLEQFAAGAGRQNLSFSDATKQTLRRFAWPGNIRQLRNVIERTCYLAEGSLIEPADLDLPVGDTAVASSLSLVTDAGEELAKATKDFQVRHINAVIARNRGNMTNAAAALGLHRSNLYRKMRQLDMNAKDQADEEANESDQP